MVYLCVSGMFGLLTARIDDLDRRERVHALTAPAFLLCLLLAWLASLFAGFALLLWPSAASFPRALRESGSTRPSIAERTQVTMLEALAGSPPWGPELLARQALIDNSATLPGL